MRTRHATQWMKCYSATLVVSALFMALYTFLAGINHESVSTRTRRIMDEQWQPSLSQRGSPPPGVSRQALTQPSRRAPDPALAPPKRLVAPRDRGFDVPINKQDKTGRVFFGIVSSIMFGFAVFRSAHNRWTAWEEAERIVRNANRDDYHIVYSRTTSEIGYGSCLDSSDWTSDITKFDV